jgi:hypothetical protein
MVYRLDPEDCNCAICDGGKKATDGYFGGTWCPCECHTLKGAQLKEFIKRVAATRRSALDTALDEFQRQNAAPRKGKA